MKIPTIKYHSTSTILATPQKAQLHKTTASRSQESNFSVQVWKTQPSDKIRADQQLDPKFFEFATPESRILDLGCGIGNITREIYDKGYTNIIGVDFNENGIKTAQGEIGDRDLKFEVADATNLSQFKDGSFDSIVSVGLLSAIVNKDKIIQVLKEAHRVLSPGGIFYNQDFRFRLDNLYPMYLESLLHGHDLGTVRSIDFENNRELKFLSHQFRKAELAHLLKQAGFNNKFELFENRDYPNIGFKGRGRKTFIAAIKK